MIQALIFDFDGLILDTELCDFLSWKEMYEEHGCELPLDLWAANIGSSDLFNPYTYLEELLGRPIDREDVHERRRLRDNELVAAQSVLPGVEAYLAGARRLKLKTAIASSSPQEWVTTHLGRLELLAHFNCIRCRDDVGGVPKPDPAVYLAALDALGIEASQAIAFEDSANGLRAAKEAGLFCIVVPNEMTRDLSFSGADLQLSSLAELPLEALLEKVRPVKSAPGRCR